jgi:hypothetical protein
VTAYEVAMNDTDLALARLERGLVNGYTAEECAEGWVMYETMVDMYLTFPFTPSHRDSLLRKLTLLRRKLEECDDVVHRRKSQTTESF